MAPTRRCSSCQAEVPAGIGFCVNCGSSVPQTPLLISRVPGTPDTPPPTPASPVAESQNGRWGGGVDAQIQWGSPQVGQAGSPAGQVVSPPPPPPPPAPYASAASAWGGPFVAPAANPPVTAPPVAPPPVAPPVAAPPPPPPPPPSAPPQRAYPETAAASQPVYSQPAQAAYSGQPAQPQYAAQPGLVPQAPTHAVAVSAVELVFDTGQRALVRGPGLLGRNPESPGMVCVVVNDPDMSISKVHLECGFDAGGFWVKDRGSTNGSGVIRAGTRERLTPGEMVRVAPGESLVLGRRTCLVARVD